LLGKKNEHREVVALVAHFQKLDIVALEVLEWRLLSHHGHVDGAVRRQVERLISSRRFVELPSPVPFEVDGVGEDHRRSRADRSGLKEFLDFVLSLVLDPAIDRLARLFRLAGIVERCDRRAVVLLHQIEVGRQEDVLVVWPDRVRDVQADFALLADGIELGLKSRKSRMEYLLAKREVQRARHLRCGGASCASVGHGQRGGDAVRGEEEVALSGAQLAVELEREGVVALRHLLDGRSVIGHHLSRP
jgi:hypothetical protein